MKFFKKEKTKRRFVTGFSLVEMLVYLAVLTLILIVVVSSVVFLLNSIKDIQASKAIENSAIIALERISREIRDAQSVDVLDSGSTLSLQSKDDKVFEFLVDGGVLVILEDGAFKGPLTLAKSEVTNLSFYQSENSGGESVRVVLTLTAGVGDSLKERTFYNTTALR